MIRGQLTFVWLQDGWEVLPKNDLDVFDPDDELLYDFTLAISGVGCDELFADVVTDDGLFMSNLQSPIGLIR